MMIKQIKDYLQNSENYYLRHFKRIYYNIGLTKQLKEKPTIFVYQMGKVASLGLYSSLKDQYEGPVIHAHTFYKFHKRYEVRKFFKHYYDNKDMKIYMISLVREPFSRNVSAFFQRFKKDTGVAHNKHNFTIEELYSMFYEDFPHIYPLIWFDINIKEHFGIDVYASDFPKEKGYKTYSHRNIKLLVMKHDLDDKFKEKLMTDFLPIDTFTLKNRNMGAKKDYAETYKKFKEKKLPDWYLERMVNSKYFQHFYTQEEIDQAVKKWKRTETVEST